MMPLPDDSILRASFRDLKADDARHTPPFVAVAAPRPAVPKRRYRLAAAAVLVTLALGALWWGTRPAPAPSVAAWRSPTDGLLYPAVRPVALPAVSAWQAPSDALFHLR